MLTGLIKVEEEVIKNCLDSLAKQTVKDFEIIVVDDGSTDKTLEIVKNVNVLQQKHQGPGAGRNLGAKHTKGDILVFVDADMTFDRNFLKMLVKSILACKTKGTNSNDEYVSNWDSKLARAYSLNENWDGKKRHPKKVSSKQKVFRAILKSEFDKVGGFTAGGYNDDWSLSEKLGYEADIAEKAIFYHKNPDTFSEIFKHAQWVGKRKYKLGILGYVAGLVRSSLPVSLVVGLSKAFIYNQPMFLPFKIVYDFGIFIGIIKYIFTKKGAK